MKDYYILLTIILFLSSHGNNTAAELTPPPIRSYREIEQIKKLTEKKSDPENLDKVTKIASPNTRMLVILNEIVGINLGLSKCVGSDFSSAYYQNAQGRVYIQGMPAEKIENSEDRQGYLNAIKINNDNVSIRHDLLSTKKKLIALARACISELAQEQRTAAQEIVDVLSQ